MSLTVAPARRLLLVAALAAAAWLLPALAAPAGAGAQCAMCKTAVQAGGEQSRRTMRTAMLVLLIPPVTIFCSIFVVAYRSRGRWGRDGDEGGSDGRG